MFVSTKLSRAILLSSLLLVAACGQKGPLILSQPSPDQNSANKQQHSEEPAAKNITEQQSTEAQ